MSDEIDEMKKKRMSELQTGETNDERAGQRVEVFTTSTCPYCVKLKNWLDSNGIEYVEHNVAEDREQAMRMIRATGQQGVPQTFISGEDGTEAVIGFQPQAIQNALGD